MTAVIVAGIFAVTIFLGTPEIVQSQLVKGSLLSLLAITLGFDVFLFGEYTGLRNRDLFTPNQAIEAVLGLIAFGQGLSYITEALIDFSFMNLGNGLEALLFASLAISGLWERTRKH